MADTRKQDRPIELDGSVWMTVGGDKLGGKGRTGLRQMCAQ
ncbi:MAG: hypothetical protein ACREYE_14580 [Gammaproteobacteria bacterium]